MPGQGYFRHITRSALAVAAGALAIGAAPPVRPLEVLGTALMRGTPGADDWRPVADATVIVRPRTGTRCVGWVVGFKAVPGKVGVDEFVYLPARVRTTTLRGAKVGPGGMDLYTHMEFAGSRGAIGRQICLTPADPLGAYKVVVSRGKQVLGRFHFVVIDGPLVRPRPPLPEGPAGVLRAAWEALPAGEPDFELRFGEPDEEAGSTEPPA